MSLPAGNILDIKNSSELRVGDYIVIEGLGFLARQWLGVGDPAALPVVAFDVRPQVGINKFAVQRPNGELLWVDGGTRDGLVKKLQDQASFTRLYVIRPKVSGPAPLPEVAPVPVNEAVLMARNLGLPKEFGGPVPVSIYHEAQIGDFIYKIAINDIRRLWKVVDDIGKSWTIRLMSTSQTRTEGPGEEISLPKTDRPTPGSEWIFRKGWVPQGAASNVLAQQPKNNGQLRQPAGGAVFPSAFTMSLVVLGIGGLAYYIWKDGQRDEDD